MLRSQSRRHDAGPSSACSSAHRRRSATVLKPRSSASGSRTRCDLLCQLAGRHQHQGQRLLHLGPLQLLDDGQPEGECLARSGLGLAADVLAVEPVGDRQQLDRKRVERFPARLARRLDRVRCRAPKGREVDVMKFRAIVGPRTTQISRQIRISARVSPMRAPLRILRLRQVPRFSSSALTSAPSSTIRPEMKNHSIRTIDTGEQTRRQLPAS